MGGLAVTLLACYLLNDATAEPMADQRRRLSSVKDVHFYILEDWPGLAVVVYSLVLMLFFIALAGVTDDYFVPALAVISLRLDLTEDVAGATFMAAGSSAPELFTSLTDVLLFESSIGIGTIVGSAVFNILVIIACSGAFALETLIIDWRPFVRDCSFYAFSILLLLIFIKLDGSGGEAYWWEGLIMIGCYGLYVLIMFNNQALMAWLAKIGGMPEKADSSDEKGPTEMERLQKPRCRAQITIEGTDMNRIPITVAMFNLFEEKTQNVQGLYSRNLDLSNQCIEIVYNKDDNNPEANRTLHATLTNAAGAAAVGSGVQFNKVNMNDVQIGTADDPEGSVKTPSVKIDAGAGDSSLPTKAEDSSDEDTPWPGPLKYLQIIVGGIASCWNWVFGWTVPECNTEDEREDWDKMADGAEKDKIDAELREREKWFVVAFIGSVVWIAVLSYLMVDLADRIGKIIGAGPVLMGLTVLAAGTSIPDALSSVATAKRGMGDMAVANAIGSNVFDILLGLGIPWVIYGALNGGKPYPVDLDKIITFVIILFATLVLTVITFIALKWRLGVRLGQLLLLLYAVFFGLAIIIAR